jgi:hypothetical protein
MHGQQTIKFCNNSEAYNRAAHHFQQYKSSMLFKIKHIFVVTAATVVTVVTAVTAVTAAAAATAVTAAAAATAVNLYYTVI